MRVEFVSDRMSFSILRGLWCPIIVLNVRAPIEEKVDDEGHLQGIGTIDRYIA
jgi:hypothetical protein